jgi:hypothetical protein
VLGVAFLLGAVVADTGNEALQAAAATNKVLTVTITNEGGTGDEAPWGRVVSTPPGISCPPTCSATFSSGTTVRLTATSVYGYSLAEWSSLPNDPACVEPPTCSVTIDESALAPSVSALFHPAAQLQAVTAGPGTLSISSDDPAVAPVVCQVDAQQETEGSTCSVRYVTGTRVTVTARPTGSARFIGWSDFACRDTSRTCKLTLTGERYIAARFSPVTLTIQGGAFGSVTVTPKPGGVCVPSENAPSCEYVYPSGTLVTLRRQHAADGQFWIGACSGNTDGLLDADTCQIRLQGNELVGAGFDNVTAIPPPLGSGLEIKLAGNGKGKVTGAVVNGTETLACGSRCSLSGLTRYDEVRVTATRLNGSRFVGWSDGSTLSRRILQLSKVNRIQARFARR